MTFSIFFLSFCSSCSRLLFVGQFFFDLFSSNIFNLHSTFSHLMLDPRIQTLRCVNASTARLQLITVTLKEEKNVQANCVLSQSKDFRVLQKAFALRSGKFLSLDFPRVNLKLQSVQARVVSHASGKRTCEKNNFTNNRIRLWSFKRCCRLCFGSVCRRRGNDG